MKHLIGENTSVIEFIFSERGRKTEKIRRGEKGIDKTVSMGFLSEIFNDEAGLNKLEEEIRASRMSEKSNVCTPGKFNLWKTLFLKILFLQKNARVSFKLYLLKSC